MEPQTKIKKNKALKNIKDTAKIIYLLRLNNIKQKQIADELNISPEAISMVINGRAKSSRVEAWLKENLGV